MAEETKHDLYLKRIQVILAILGGLAAVIIGFYNIRKNVFTDNTPGILAVSVRSDQGRSIAAAHIELYDSQNAVVASSETSGNGSYTDQDIVPGSYLLKITSSGYEPQAATIKIDPKKTTHLDLVLRSFGNTQSPGSPIKSALEDVGATWIKKFGKTSEQAQK